MEPTIPHLFLDTEFNGLGGQLISMAMVSEFGDQEPFYEVLSIPVLSIDPWVNLNVMPILGKPPIDHDLFLLKLGAFLRKQANHAQIFADWPADFEHLCAQMTLIGARNDFNMPVACRMNLINTPQLKPAIRHNALSDAQALRDWYVEADKASRLT